MVKAHQQYGKLFVLGRFNKTSWACICSCGCACTARSDELQHGTKTDCGCVFKPSVPGHVGRNRYEYQGVVYTVEEIEAKFRIYRSTFLYRIQHGSSVVDAIERPIRVINLPQRRPLC